MATNISFPSITSQVIQNQIVSGLELPLDPTIAERFPPGSLDSNVKVALGVRFLEQYGTTHFPFFQRVYQLTKEECKEIYLKSVDVTDNIVTWEPLSESYCPKEVAVIRESFPGAKFHLLSNRKENTRDQPIVEVDGKKYYFYSHAFKGPVVDANYIRQFGEAQEWESRPNYTVLNGDGITVFLMEFHGTENPEFREPEEIHQIIDLIFRFSFRQKGLDMLPCRLAFDNGKLYCTDQKLNYGIFDSPWKAFQNNIQMLKGKIEYRRYPEQAELFAFIDQAAAQYRIPLFLKTIENKCTYQVREMIPSESLSLEERVDLTAAVLRTQGTKDLAYMAREYQLSYAEQQESIRRAGTEIKDNLVTWDSDISGEALSLKQEAERAGIHGDFKLFCNRIGNYKHVLTVNLEGQIYVVRKTDPQYVEEYRRRKDREHRPDFLTFPGEGADSVIFLSKFMGVQPIDYLNFAHLQMIVDLSNDFAEDALSTIDFNRGNLIVSGDRLHYIDKDLTYTKQQNPRLYHFEHIIDSINQNLFTQSERKTAEQCIKLLIRQKLDFTQPSDWEIFKEIFPFQWLTSIVDGLDLTCAEDRALLGATFSLLDRMSPSEAESARQYIRIKLDQYQ